MGIEQFQDIIQQKANELYRDMPWREDTRPYFVLVSELMLQQTQVARVIPKFEAFINAFPSEKELAVASLADVLIHWQGLGYNRRAKFLHEAAKAIVVRGTFPDTYEDLLELPGVGKNTAGAILAYSFNQPSIFIETNIRTVYIHHFFNDQFDIDDKQLIALLEQTIDREHPREFYWTLMDYGSWLKSSGVRNIASSKHYKKQSPLSGSLREMRGMIIRNLSNNTGVEQLKADARFAQAVNDLEREGMIDSTLGIIKLTK
jgi:A/G-specific adenine glycosylase